MTDSKAPLGPEVPGAADTWAWDWYWRDGRLASCGGARGANYQPFIAEAWRRFFACLAPGSRILDACTGNGAIARLAAETADTRGVRFRIEAFDSAAIAPGVLESSPFDMIAFRGRVAAESTPYAAGVFDCVVGQYAIEYSTLELSLAEMARVSRRGCRVRFVTHATASVVVASARRQLEDVARLRQGGSIFAAARGLAEAMAQAAPARTREQAAARYRTAVEILGNSARESVEPEMFHNVSKVLTHALSVQRSVGPQAVLGKIAESERNLDAHASRLSAMTRAALDENSAHAMARTAEALWEQSFRCEPVVRPADRALFGWAIESADTAHAAA